MTVYVVHSHLQGFIAIYATLEKAEARVAALKDDYNRLGLKDWFYVFEEEVQ